MNSRTTIATLRILAVGLIGLAAAVGAERLLAAESGGTPTSTSTSSTTTSVPPTTSTITTTTTTMASTPAERLCEQLSNGELVDSYQDAWEQVAKSQGTTPAERSIATARLGRDLVSFCYRTQSEGRREVDPDGAGRSGSADDGQEQRWYMPFPTSPTSTAPGEQVDSGAGRSGSQTQGGQGE